ncbi:hypothetical protein ACO2RV_16910 [Ancylobacter sp. VNQ12]|uniref:hypothetical protein n=1 Tax=Ancylobacter sp. VNQ12 TaxID=3400920 RepID=UPI003BFF88A4
MGDLQDGQIYRWQYHHEAGRTYWCKSRIAIVQNGRLYDTYWGYGPDPLDPADVKLTLLCDQSWPKINAWQVAYYARSDVVDTRHSNSMSAAIYLRPGAVRSAAAITAALEHAEETANSDLRMAQWRLERLQEQRALLQAGRLDEVSL